MRNTLTRPNEGEKGERPGRVEKKRSKITAKREKKLQEVIALLVKELSMTAALAGAKR